MVFIINIENQCLKIIVRVNGLDRYYHECNYLLKQSEKEGFFRREEECTLYLQEMD